MFVQTEQHPITSAIDGTNQWWQSPSIKNGRQFHWVTITLDLRQVGLAVEHCAVSPQIHTSLINGRPSADDLTPELLEFTSARFIRLRLQRIRTLNADLMTLSYRDPKDVDPIVTRRYYYSIKDISVGGMCICYGHAQSCPWDPVTKLQCVCEHNTCGESCNECCPGYHQEPWQPGTLSDGNTCEKCNCHNKAEDCYYNQTVADLRLSVNTLGQFVGGGVCVNCSQNTAGVNCQTCADGYYRPHQVCVCPGRRCLACECNGNVDPAEAGHCDGRSGECLKCLGHTAGRHCERCADGFYGDPLFLYVVSQAGYYGISSGDGCRLCECNQSGALSASCDEEGRCQCITGVTGEKCDRCERGYYSFTESGCTRKSSALKHKERRDMNMAG
uniref:Uncharacterized protein n=1 Tax=Sinocyclocheilus anshuiensis TaxID=1608454 RepID=A0A671NY82_9TELE